MNRDLNAKTGHQDLILPPADSMDALSLNRLLMSAAIEPSGTDPLDPVVERPFQSDDVRALLKKRARHQLNVYNLSDANITETNLEHNPHPAAQALLRARYNTKHVWNKVKLHGGSAPTLSNKYFLEFAMEPGAKIVEVTAGAQSPDNTRITTRDVLAYALINTEQNRLSGLFNPHNLFFPRKYLTRLVMDQVIKEFEDRPIRTRVITSPERFANLASYMLMIEYGFEPDGTHEIIPDALVPAIPGVRDKEEEFQLVSTWMERKPGPVTDEQLKHLRDLDQTMRRTAQALSPGTVFTASDATLAFWHTGKERNAPFYFAQMQPENFVYAVPLESPNRFLYGPNLEYAEGNLTGELFEPGTLNGIFIYDDVLSEVCSKGGNVADFLKAQVKQLKTDGQLVIKGKITPELTRSDLIQMARRDLNCRISRYVPVHYYGEEYFELYLQPSESIAIREIAGKRIEEPSYLTRTFYKHAETGEERELVKRKFSNEVIDLIAYSEDGRILQRTDSPRGIPEAMFHKVDGNGLPRDYHLDGVLSSGHEAESIGLIRKDGESVEEAVRRGLRERAGIPEDAEIEIEPQGKILFTDPARYEETKIFVRVKIPTSSEVRKIENDISGFSHSGKVESRRVSDILKSNQLTSPSLTVAAYELLEDLKGISTPMWPTAQKVLRDQQGAYEGELQDAKTFFGTRRPFTSPKWEQISAPSRPENQFNEIWDATFAEYGRDGLLLPTQDAPRTVKLQYATTAEHLNLTNNRIPVCLCYRSGENYRFGYQLADDKPLVEHTLKQHELADGYDFYIPNNIKPESYPDLKAFLMKRVEEETGLKVLSVRRLGRELLDSSGLTPTRSFPVLIEVDASSIPDSNTYFCDALDVKDNARRLRSLATRATTYRALHALGLLDEQTYSRLDIGLS